MNRRTMLYLGGALLGAVLGWVYWKYAGCTNGTCAITSRPISSAAYGALLGAVAAGLLADLFTTDREPS